METKQENIFQLSAPQRLLSNPPHACDARAHVTSVGAEGNRINVFIAFATISVCISIFFNQMETLCRLNSLNDIHT